MNPEKKNADQIMDMDDMDDDPKPMQVIQGPQDFGGGTGAPLDFDDVSDGDDDNMFAEKKPEEFKASEKPAADHLFVKVRKYDLSITYDFYTQTPRLWLTGYSEDGQPLTNEEIFQDIAADYAKKTVTIESHPHTGIK